MFVRSEEEGDRTQTFLYLLFSIQFKRLASPKHRHILLTPKTQVRLLECELALSAVPPQAISTQRGMLLFFQRKFSWPLVFFQINPLS